MCMCQADSGTVKDKHVKTLAANAIIESPTPYGEAIRYRHKYRLTGTIKYAIVNHVVTPSYKGALFKR